MENLVHYPSYIDHQNILLRCEEIRKKDFFVTVDKIDQQRICRELISYIDLTSLNSTDTEKVVIDLCHKALSIEDLSNGIPSIAAVCTYPNFTQITREHLSGSGIKTASVATAFPFGQTFLSVKLLEVTEAIAQGAHEIDMVLPLGAFLSKKYDTVFQEIAEVKKSCKNSLLKVILETGELKNIPDIALAAQIAIDAGADFIKTSTGKSSVGATLEAALVMAEIIRDYHQKTGKRIGLKVSGGISTLNEAWKYYHLVKTTLGEEWQTPNLFRIGASSLLNDLLLSII